MDIAVIGMTGIFPGSSNVDQFYLNLLHGKDCIGEVSQDRLSTMKNLPHRGYLDKISSFDHSFFNISLSEAENMDPHQRILLEQTYHLLNDAGYSASKINGTKTSVILSSFGGPKSEYVDLIDNFHPTILTGNSYAIAAGRISNYFNFTGPSMMIDTSCSSSLVAIHEACNKLKLEECDYAIAGGFRIFSNLEDEEKFEFVLDAPDSRCKAFADTADGIVAGEGGGLILLKPLKQAIKDKDIIHVVIKGSAINQDGNRSNGLTAPSPIAQSEVIVSAWNNAKVTPESIGYIEAHGTGTRLGDPIEIKGLDDAFKSFKNLEKKAEISSLKSNIGHLGEASGIASFIKATLAIKNKTYFKTLHFEKPNQFINFDNSAVNVTSETKTWGEDRFEKRRAGISSFGMSGTNAHIVIEEAPIFIENPKIKSDQNDSYLFTLSAKTEDSFYEQKSMLLTHFDKASINSLESVSYTLNQGRDDFEYRTCLVAQSKEELIKKLKDQGAVNIKNNSLNSVHFLLSNDFDYSQELIDRLISQNKKCNAQFNEIQKNIKDTRNKNVQKFVQYCVLYTYWNSLGLKPEKLLGTGIGNLFIDYIYGYKTIKECLKIAETENFETKFRKDIFIDYIKETKKSQTILYVALSPNGELIDAISEVENVELVSLLKDTNQSILLQISELYSKGLSIDWDVFYENNNIQKEWLPSYSFENTSCWIIDLKDKNRHSDFINNYLEPSSTQSNYLESKNINEKSIELQVQEVLQDILKVNEVKNTDDFFEIGGSSLIAISVVEELEKRFETSLDYDMFFDYATPQEIAIYISGLLPEDTPLESRDINEKNIEIQVQEVLQDILKVDEVKNTDDFFEIGGSSLIAISVVEELEKRFETSLDYDMFFDYATPQEIAIYISGLLPEDTPLESKDINEKSIEVQVQEILQDILKVDEVKNTDDFFEIGGSSLIAISVVEELEKRFETSLDYDMFFDYATPQEISKYISELRSEPNINMNLKEFKKVEESSNNNELQKLFPLSYSQEGMWYLQQLYADNSFYNVPVCLKIKESLNVELMNNCINKLIKRHSILTATFPIVNGQPFIKLNENVEFLLEEFDLENCSIETLEQKKQEIRDSILLNSFNLETDQLFKGAVIKVSNSEFEVIFCMHHIITDDLSYKIFLKELFDLYFDQKNTEKFLLNPVTYQFTDYSQWQRDEGNDELKNHVGYWTKKLKGAPEVLELVIQKNRPNVQTFNGGTEKILIDSMVLNKLNVFNKKHSSSNFITLFSAFNTLLYKYSGQKDLVVGFPVAGRKIFTENTMGNFVNTLAVRTPLYDEQSFVEYLKVLKTEIYSGFKHMDAPFNLVVEDMNLKRSLSHTPIYQIMFDFHNDTSSDEILNSKVEVLPLNLQVDTVRCDMEFLLSINSDDTIDGMIFYNTDIFIESDIKEFVSNYKKLLNEILDNPESGISNISLEEKNENIINETSNFFEEDFSF